MADLLQANRTVKVTSPFGGDVLAFGRMSATEAMSQCYELNLTLFSAKGDLNPDTILGKPLAINMTVGEPIAQRYFHGLVTDFAQAGYDNQLHEYRATVRPWLWFLTRSADCRVFQSKTVPDIFKEVCSNAGFSDYKLALSGSYDPWDYCVQYRESDFNFVSRLLEHEGIFYYFEHTASKHTLVLCDDAGQLTPASGYASVPYFPPVDPTARRERDHLDTWVFQKSFQPAAYATRDYDFKTPTPVLAGTSTISRKHEASRYEVFEYPASTATQSSAALEKNAKIRVQELQVSQMTARGGGNAAGLATGKLFKLTGYPRSDLNIQYVVTSTSIELLSDSYQTGMSSGGEQFTIALEAVDAREAYRPQRVTVKPLVFGTQTAVVVGPKGEEIYTDEHSRVKVQFHWDRYGKLDENSSCWVRVGHAAAGKSFGALQIPRIGQEVIVTFLEGDPDRPLIIGSVYNGSNKPPYALPANKTQSGMKSRSSMSGTGENFNEIRFEDKKGAEQLFIHAEMNQDIEVEKDETHSVGNDRKKDIKHDEITTIGNDRTEKVAQNEKISIGKNRDINVDGAETAAVKLDRTHTVGKNETIKVDADQNVKVGKDHDLNVGAAQKITVGKDQSINVSKDRTIDVGSNQSSTIGKSLVIDAGDSVTIRTGKASITMHKNGSIVISGKDIRIDGDGAIDVKAVKNVQLKARKILSN
jgi:type VI secretion system secreted protein VgrG